MPSSTSPASVSTTPSRTRRRSAAVPRAPGIDPMGAAVRLLSETAHDLKSPLAGIAATMELMRDGDLGAVTPSQMERLQAAMNQCQYIDTLIGELAQADRLRSGSPRVRRVASKRIAICAAVQSATRTLLSNKKIDLLWDGVTEDSLDVMVDPTLLCRLLVNLIVNAERASREQSPILIRVEDNLQRGVATWSVMDRGRGMSTERLEQIQASQTMASDCGGEGLGLMIARQMAALHHSPLILRSRAGSGTDAVFETPLTTPAAIATTFARFRAEVRGKPSRPQSIRQWKQRRDASVGNDPKRLRLEAAQPNASGLSTWAEIRLFGDGVKPMRSDRLALGRVSTADSCSMETADRFDELLQTGLSPFEMAYRTSRRSWVWVLDADHHTLPARIDQIETAAYRANPGVSLRWSEPSVVPIQERPLQCLLLDAMTTRSLAEAPGTIPDVDTVRLGTPELTGSPVPAARLDEELRRLHSRMKTQAERLRQQSAALRPNR